MCVTSAIFLSNTFKGENPNFTLVVTEQWFNKVVKHTNTQLQILLPWKCLDRNQLQLWLMLNLSPSFIYMEMTQTVTVGKAADAQTVIMLKRLVAVGAMHHRPIEAE